MSEKDDILADGIITRQIQLLRFTANTRGQVLEILRRMEEELTEKLFYSGRKLTDIGRDDLARLLRQTTDLIEQYYSEAAGYMGNELTALGRVEAVAVAASLDGAFRGAVTPSLPTEAYFRRLADNTLIQGAPSAAWWKQQSEQTAFRFSNEVRQGLAQAETNAQIVQRIMGRATGYSVVEGKRVYRYAGGAMDVERRNAAALVQTSVQAVANTARRDTFLANDDIIKGVRHISTLDSHTTTVCVGYSGAAWSIPGYKPIAPNTKEYGGGTPRHWNCLPADSLVTTRGDVTGVSKRWFDGKMIVVSMASGRKFSCTPNHPVLTPGGWQRAHHLHVGGHVVGDGGREWGTGSNCNSQDVPTAIHQFSEAWLRARAVLAEPVPVAPEDFHGDGIGSKIAVVYSDRFLWDRDNTAREQHAGKFGFIVGLAARAVRLVRAGHSLKPTWLGGLAAYRSVGSKGERLALLGRAVAHADLLLRAAIARRNAGVAKHAQDQRVSATEAFGHAFDADARVEQRPGLFERNIGTQAPVDLDAGSGEAAVHSGAPDLEHARELIGGFAGAVFADQIVDIQVDAFHGYVYNLETVGGWYTANGIVTHNCRSVEIPITKTFRELGIDMDEFDPSSTTRSANGGPVAADLSFGAYLKRKPDSFVDDLLGPGRAQLWRDGKIKLPQLLDQTGRPLTLKELRKKYGG